MDFNCGWKAGDDFYIVFFPLLSEFGYGVFLWGLLCAFFVYANINVHSYLGMSPFPHRTFHTKSSLYLHDTSEISM